MVTAESLGYARTEAPADPAPLVIPATAPLLTGKRIGLDLPNRLNPGPLAARITVFAPVSLLFFVTVLLILGILRRRNLHPMHYFFLSAAFFSRHFSTNCSRAGGTDSRYFVTGSGVSVMCAERIICGVVPKNGGLPVSNSYAIAPTE